MLLVGCCCLGLAVFFVCGCLLVCGMCVLFLFVVCRVVALLFRGFVFVASVCVVRCLMLVFVVCCSLFDLRCSLFVVSCSLWMFVVRGIWFVVCGVLFVVCCFLFVV